MDKTYADTVRLLLAVAPDVFANDMRFVERAYSVVHTCRQHERSAFDFFYDSLDSYFHGPTPPPSLVPSG